MTSVTEKCSSFSDKTDYEGRGLLAGGKLRVWEVRPIWNFNQHKGPQIMYALDYEWWWEFKNAWFLITTRAGRTDWTAYLLHTEPSWSRPGPDPSWVLCPGLQPVMFTRSLITAEPWPGPGRVVNPIVKTESGNKIFMSGCKTCAGHHQPHKLQTVWITRESMEPAVASCHCRYIDT